MNLTKNNWIALAIGIPVIALVVHFIFSKDENKPAALGGTGTGLLGVNWRNRFERGINMTLGYNQQQSLDGIISAFGRYGDGDDNKIAYILATAWHESRMEPVRECFAINDAAARQCVQNRSYAVVINGQVYYGRGLVQLTWLSNYEKMGRFLGIDLVNNPDQALEPTRAAEILVYGMMQGSFTGKRLSQYITSSSVNFYDARRVVNGTDRASLISGYAESILAA